MKKNKKDGLNVLLLFAQMCQANSTRPPTVLYGMCKVTWFCTCMQENELQRINKTQEHKAEAADTGTAIARIC